MTDHVYKQITITGTSSESMEAAVRNAIARAARSLKELRWFEVVEVRGNIDGPAVAHWQVTVKIGFTILDDTEMRDAGEGGAPEEGKPTGRWSAVD